MSVNGPVDVPVDLLEEGVRATLERKAISGAEVSVTLLDDPGIRALNRRYLERDRPTDVIAFPLYEPDEPVVGDVYVGLDQARRQAAELRIPLREELLRLAVHGTLHVLGHDHPGDGDREESEMFRIQEELVRSVLAREAASESSARPDSGADSVSGSGESGEGPGAPW
ncbi:MAG: rRNA maturation RNase YbeY [Gemmatimonadota bacterium]